MVGVYFKAFTPFVSWLILSGGLIFFLSMLQVIGTKANISMLRPSYYINLATENVYYFVMTCSYTYGYACKVITRLNEVIAELIEKVFPWIKPFFTAMREASGVILKSLREFVIAPLIGLADGLDLSIKFRERKNSFTLFFALVSGSYFAMYCVGITNLLPNIFVSVIWSAFLTGMITAIYNKKNIVDNTST